MPSSIKKLANTNTLLEKDEEGRTKESKSAGEREQVERMRGAKTL